MRRGGSYALSAVLHLALLAWVASPPARRTQRAKSLYEQEIAPHRDRLVWYSFREKLPQVSPLERRGPSQPPRTRVKALQPIVAQPPRALPVPQLIWRPAPEIELPREIRLPNLVAVAAPPRPKAFTAPRDRPRPRAPQPVLDDAPRVAMAAVGAAPFAGPARRPPVRAFQAPQAQPVTRSPLLLPEPAIAVAAGASRSGFQAPVHVPKPAATIDEQPEIGGAGGGLSVAVIGLNPAAKIEAPLPEGSRPARISAGPEPGSGAGGAEPVETARLFVPDLMVRNGPRDARPSLLAQSGPVTSPENLRAALRTAPRLADIASAARVASAPLPYFEGRTIYSMAVQMPNITSYSGSWLIWLAERGGPDRAGLRPPVPLRKVDPKYVATAVEERVEGKVRLAAVIRRDGHVDTVTVVEHLDDRLDRSAIEALAKWQFEPASRAGSPVEVDAVIEIPFRLRPREAR